MPILIWLRGVATSVGGRIALGSAAFVGLFWLQFDPSLPPADPEKIAGIGAAVFAWVWAEVLTFQTSAHPHDVQLMQTLRARFSDDDRNFVRAHDFENGHDRRQMVAFSDFERVWTGAAYEFHDRKMQNALADLTVAIKAFHEVVVLNTVWTPGSPEYRLRTPRYKDDDEMSERGEAIIREMNQRAQATNDALDKIERLARERLRV